MGRVSVAKPDVGAIEIAFELFLKRSLATCANEDRDFAGAATATLDNIVAVQAMFPVTSPAETAGQGKENKIAKAAAKGDVVAVWDELAKRLSKNKEYVELFKAAFPCEIASKHDITYARAANAIAMP